MRLKIALYLIRKACKKIQRRIRSWLYSPEKDLLPVMEMMPKLRKDLKSALLMPNQLAAVVALFAALAPFYEQETLIKLIQRLNQKNYGQLDRLIISISTIQTQINQSFFAYKGVYRAGDGVAVNEHSIWLGGIYGILSRPIAYWLEKKEESDNNKNYVNENRGLPDKTWFMINDYQAGHLLGFTDKIVQEIDELEVAYQQAGFRS